MKMIVPKKFLLSAAAGLFAMSLATQAYAFCFSNDSLSNTPMTVQQMDRSKVLQTISDISKKIANTSCKALTAQEKLSGGKTKDCKEIKNAFAKLPAALKDVDRELRNNKYTGPAVRTLESAANDVYSFVAGAPVTGDAINLGGQVINIAADNASKAVREIAGLGKQLIAAVDKLVSARFRQTVHPDGKKCCSWKDRDCNPSGKKDAKIYFNIKYAGKSRIMHVGATDHVLCRINKNNPKATGCKSYVWPYSPSFPNKKTVRGVMIKSDQTGKCLEVGGWKKNNGANVNMWRCHGGKNQRWVIYKNGTLRSEMNWKCLDVAVADPKQAKNGSNVTMHDCHGKRNQRWLHLTHINEIRSDVPTQARMCLEVGGWKPNNGANANIWKCGKKQANQRWHLTKDVTFDQVLKVRYPGKCIDNTGGKKKGTKIHSWDCNAKNVNQQWTFKKRGSYYEVKSKRSGLCLDVSGGKKNNGAKVIQWSCHGRDNQQWKIENADKGWFRLRSRSSNRCLDLKGPHKENGTPFQIWDCKNVKNQMFQEVG